MAESKSNSGAPVHSAAGLGLQLAVGMAVFTGLGYWLDQKRGDGVLLTLCGAGLGFIYILYELWKVARSTNAKGGPTHRPPSNEHARRE
ncbi:MAG: AtpZ/AtpI family protein [Kiritimatiellae bacterium]|nr:AtpZ/AtpI family protein [Kiritimatiellia bacterium]MDW8459300.1 AtpZ/AtpI family protein [Verrucomicrobiota bacterium]